MRRSSSTPCVAPPSKLRENGIIRLHGLRGVEIARWQTLREMSE